MYIVEIKILKTQGEKICKMYTIKDLFDMANKNYNLKNFS